MRLRPPRPEEAEAVAALVIAGLVRVLPRRPAVVAPVAAVAALVSVPVAALAFVGLYGIGGTAPVPLDALTGAMVGVHLLIGLGEALVTGLVVASVMAVRPDLVHAARTTLPVRELEIRTPSTTSTGTGASA
jgi:cobalt/nickel transport system permease protein